MSRQPNDRKPQRQPSIRLSPARAVLRVCVGAGLGSTVGLVMVGAPRPVSGQTTPAYARHGMVASSSDHASRIGADVLKRGGNAVDAAVAVGLAMAVTYPTAGNLGGGGFMLLRMEDGRTAAIDFRETAPAKAHRELYVDPKTGKVREEESTVGYRAAGVPGSAAGFGLALEKFGTRKWSELIEPARQLADRGFPVSYDLAGELKTTSVLGRFPETRRVFQRDGRFYEPGETFRQPDLAATLKRMQERGPREFYEGRTARLLAEDMERNHGLITLEDLKAYRPVVREVLQGSYRGYTILTMPPPSSGGIALLEMLNLLEPLDVKGMGHNSSRKYHALIEVMRRAFADRAEYLGDPDFVKVPVVGLTSKAYAQKLFKTIDFERATPSEKVRGGKPLGYESPQTTHYSVVDRFGNAVSVTYTLNTAYGSGATVKGAGFLLNNEMDDFTSQPGTPNRYGLLQGEANAIAPRKRPLSSMTPTIVLKDGRLRFVTGSPGGPTIINTVLQTVVNVIDHEMNIQQAVGAPRIHHQWMPDEIRHEPYGLAPDVIQALRAKGHRFVPNPRYIGDAQAIAVDPGSGWRMGASDPRSPDGLAVGH